MEIDSLAQTVMRIGRVSRPPCDWWVTPITNTNTLMPDFNNLVMDSNKEVLNISRHIFDDEQPKCYRQAVSRPNAELWYSAIETQMDALWRNHAWDVVDRTIDRQFIDSKWSIKLRACSTDPSTNSKHD
jgi:hypothetical protein